MYGALEPKHRYVCICYGYIYYVHNTEFQLTAHCTSHVSVECSAAYCTPALSAVGRGSAALTVKVGH